MGMANLKFPPHKEYYIYAILFEFKIEGTVEEALFSA